MSTSWYLDLISYFPLQPLVGCMMNMFGLINIASRATASLQTAQLFFAKIEIWQFLTSGIRIQHIKKICSITFFKESLI